MGIWIEDGTIVPKPGDIILYNWGQSYQPNNGYSDHIGFVESVSGGQITCIEGNKEMCIRDRIIGYDENIMIYHSADEKEEKSETQEGKTSEEKTEEDEETVEQIFDTLSEKQKNVIYAMFGQAFGEPDKPEDKNDDSKGGKTEMKHNVFDNEKKNETGGFLR